MLAQNYFLTFCFRKLSAAKAIFELQYCKAHTGLSSFKTHRRCPPWNRILKSLDNWKYYRVGLKTLPTASCTFRKSLAMCGVDDPLNDTCSSIWSTMPRRRTAAQRLAAGAGVVSTPQRLEFNIGVIMPETKTFIFLKTRYISSINSYKNAKWIILFSTSKIHHFNPSTKFNELN